MNLSIESFPSPMGHIEVASTPGGEIAGLWVSNGETDRRFESHLKAKGFSAVRSSGDPETVRQQFDTWFAGELRQFELPLFAQGSSFERAVWKELTSIPYGETTTYGEIASAIGFTGEAQRVGAACGANPWLIVVPCHRVIAADGSLRGYAAGLHVKAQLLAHERGQPALALT